MPLETVSYSAPVTARLQGVTTSSLFLVGARCGPQSPYCSVSPVRRATERDRVSQSGCLSGVRKKRQKQTQNQSKPMSSCREKLGQKKKGKSGCIVTVARNMITQEHGHPVTRSPSHPIAQLPDHPVTRLPLLYPSTAQNAVSTNTFILG